MKEAKTKIIRVRIEADEYQHLFALSKQNNCTISEYIRHCLLEDPHLPPPFTTEQKELMKLVVRMFCLVKEIAKDTLSQQQYQECNELAEEVLRKWNYE